MVGLEQMCTFVLHSACKSSERFPQLTFVGTVASMTKGK